MTSGSDLPARITFGRFCLMPRRRELLVEGRSVKLGSRAFDVLLALIEAQGSVVSKDALMARVWPGQVVEENNLEVQISMLPTAFGAERGLIRTVSRRGYQFTGEIRLPADGEEARVGTSAVSAKPVASPATNLPQPVSELIGRDDALDEVLRLVAAQRLVTLTGAGGIGKTRLALAAARRLLQQFAEGVWLAEFAPLSDPDLVPATVAAAVGLELAPGAVTAEGVASALNGKVLLLVLDNCEHVIDAAAMTAEAVLRANGSARVIATSREPLCAEGEQIYPVPPLAVPAAEIDENSDALEYGAIRLFVERVRAAEPRFAPDRRLLALIAVICRRLDGIPLAIELAAARVSTLGIEELAVRLDERFDLLTGGRRTALPRHQTLRATLDWSYQLLAEPERMLLRRLAIFAGPFNLEAAVAIAASPELAASEVIDGISSLVAKSLVAAEGESAARYQLLDTTRAYALEKLSEDGERDRFARRHAEYYYSLFLPAEADSQSQTRAEWLAAYGGHLDNVRLALDWAFSAGGDLELGIALTAAVVPLWTQLSLLEECRMRVEKALASIGAATAESERLRMQLSAGLAWSLMYGEGRAEKAGPAWATTLELAERLGDRAYWLRALWGQYNNEEFRGDVRKALEYARRFAALVEGAGNVIDLMMGERMLATGLHYLGDQTEARRHIENALVLLAPMVRQSESARLRLDMRVSTHYFHARILSLQGLADQAMRATALAIEEGRTIGQPLNFCSALGQAACPISFLAGDLDAAARYGAMLIEHAERHRIRLWQIWARCFLSLVAIKRGEAAEGLTTLRGELEKAGDARLLHRFLLILAEFSACLGEVGEIADGLANVDNTLNRCKALDQGLYLPELLRIKGDLLLKDGAAGSVADAKGCFHGALQIAERQGALFWELRSALSLARLLVAEARLDAARKVLAPVYLKFTEGFNMADMIAARALLDALPAAPVGREA